MVELDSLKAVSPPPAALAYPFASPCLLPVSPAEARLSKPEYRGVMVDEILDMPSGSHRHLQHHLSYLDRYLEKKLAIVA